MKQLNVGLTGLSRAGKTVFLTSAIYHLLELTGEHLDEFRMHGWRYAGTRGQVKKTSEMFTYREKYTTLRDDPPDWPEPTVDVTEFPIHLRLINDDETRQECQINFLDYPGERLLDVALLETTYEEWCTDLEDQFATADGEFGRAVQTWKEHFEGMTSDRKEFPKSRVRSAQQVFGMVCKVAHASGHPIAPVDPVLAPEGDDVLAPFFPMDAAARKKYPAMTNQMQARYDRYLRKSAKPFLSRIGACQHQVVLVDILGILQGGLERYTRDRDQMYRILDCYRSLKKSWTSWFTSPLTGGGINRVTFCATKADQAVEPDRPHMTELLKELFNKARTGLEFDHKSLKGFDFFSLAAYRSTDDVETTVNGQSVPALKGLKEGKTEPETYVPARVPLKFPSKKDAWTKFDFPPVLPRKESDLPDEQLPHLNLDRLLFEILEDVL